MSQQLNKKIEGSLRKEESAVDKLRATLLWYLADRQWHSATHLLMISLPVIEKKDALNQYELSKAARASTVHEAYDIEVEIGVGSNKLFRAAIESLLHDGSCKSRGTGHELQIQRVRVHKSARDRIQTMDSANKDAMQRAQEWLDTDFRPTGLQVLQGLINAMKRPVDRYVAYPVASAVAGWYQSQLATRSASVTRQQEETKSAGVSASPTPQSTAPIGGDVQDHADGQPRLVDFFPNPTVPVSISQQFWTNLGFFDERRLFYFPAQEANAPSRVLCKSLAVEMMNNPKSPMARLAFIDLDEAKGWIQENWRELLRESLLHCVTEKIFGWAEREASSVQPRHADEEASREWIESQIDWGWIAERLQHELKRHSHRKGLRALELALSEPFEHIEARLGDFVGSLEELFMRGVQKR